MQPEFQQPIPAPSEQLPPQVGLEQVPSLPPIEVQVGAGQEAYEQRADSAGIAQLYADPVGQQPILQQPVAPPPYQVQQPSQATLIAPMIAADEDLIEKEWVDKAKEIIKSTADDPHARTAQVSELQRSYLEKRYGKKIGVEED